MRGGVKYLPAIGWTRLALQVNRKYDRGNDTWLGMNN